MSSTRSRILHRFGPSRIQVFRFRVYADLSRSPACFPLLRPLLTSHGISSLGSPQERTRCFPAQPLHLPRRRNLWVSLCGASSPDRIGLLCSSCSSAHRFRLAFLPRSVTLPELASTSDLISCFHVWFFHRGLSPHLQRAHAGRTPDAPHEPRASSRSVSNMESVKFRPV